MEINISTEKFVKMNFNLKKIILSFLNLCDQRKIYWSNKKLRSLLPDTALKININSLKKRNSYLLDEDVYGLLEMNDGSIACWMRKEIRLFKLNNSNNLEFVNNFPFGYTYYGSTFYPIKHNGHIIFTNGLYELRKWDMKFNLVLNFEEDSNICSLCNISYFSFAAGFSNGCIKIYSLDKITQKYIVVNKYNCHESRCKIYSLFYLPIHDLLLSCSIPSIIHVFNIPQGNHGKSIEMKNMNEYVTSLLLINNQTLVSASSDGEINLWSINEDLSFICLKSVKCNDNFGNWVSIYLLGNDLLLSMEYDKNVFSIFELKTFRNLDNFKENSGIKKILVTKNNTIITKNILSEKLNIWKILE